MTGLSGQTAIVTGASKGIGEAIATRFAAEGANVVVNSRSPERAEEAAAEIEAEADGGEVVGVAADVSDYEDVRKRTPMARYGSLDEMAECALFLTAQNNYVTGEVLTADGGWTADAWRYWDDRGE